jgi:hypothetical protein
MTIGGDAATFLALAPTAKRHYTVAVLVYKRERDAAAMWRSRTGFERSGYAVDRVANTIIDLIAPDAILGRKHVRFPMPAQGRELVRQLTALVRER